MLRGWWSALRQLLNINFLPSISSGHLWHNFAVVTGWWSPISPLLNINLLRSLVGGQLFFNYWTWIWHQLLVVIGEGVLWKNLWLRFRESSRREKSEVQPLFVFICYGRISTIWTWTSLNKRNKRHTSLFSSTVLYSSLLLFSPLLYSSLSLFKTLKFGNFSSKFPREFVLTFYTCLQCLHGYVSPGNVFNSSKCMTKEILWTSFVVLPPPKNCCLRNNFLVILFVKLTRTVITTCYFVEAMLQFAAIVESWRRGIWKDYYRSFAPEISVEAVRRPIVEESSRGGQWAWTVAIMCAACTFLFPCQILIPPMWPLWGTGAGIVTTGKISMGRNSNSAETLLHLQLLLATVRTDCWPTNIFFFADHSWLWEVNMIACLGPSMKLQKFWWSWIRYC